MSFFGITRPVSTEMQYVILRFYKPIPGTNKVDYVFVVVHNYELMIKAVRQEYADFTEDQQKQAVEFESTEMLLDLSFPGPEIVDGWKIQPLTCPKLTKAGVKQFQPNTPLVPACTIQLEWIGEGQQQQLFHKVTILGAKEPNFFYMRYYPEAADTHAATSTQKVTASSSSPRTIEDLLDKPPDIRQLLNRVAIEARDKWRLVGIELGMKRDQLDVISEEKNPIIRYSEVFSQWEKKADPDFPFSWRTILNAFGSTIVEENRLAMEIEEWLRTVSKDKNKLETSEKENDVLQEQINTQSLEIEKLENKLQPLSVSTVNTAVQVDYLAVAKSYLRGVEVFGEIVLEVVGDKPQKLEWPGYGFYIEVPEGALLPGVTASVAVKVLLGGQFELPKDSQLISAIYWISSSEVFLKEVAVNIQHCAIITSVKQFSELKFVVARCSQEKLPYKFKEKNGLFNIHTQYAAIKVKQFSIFALKSSKNTELRCVSLKFYKPIPYTKRVNYHFILVCDLDICVKAARHKYKILEFKEETQTQTISFVSSEVELDLPFSSPKTVNGWKIQPLTYPLLAKTDVQHFQPSKQVPACSIELEWTGEGRQQEFVHKVTIIGAKEPNNVFVMRYYPEATNNETMAVPQQPNSTAALEYPPPTAAAATAASSTNSEIAATQQSTDSHQEQVSENPLDKPPDTLQLLNKVASKSKDKWRLVGIGLGIEEGQLDVISDEKDPILRYSKVFSQWKRKADPKFLFNWRTILNVLRSPIIEENSLAKEIEEWLTTSQ